jgi:DNA polymerase I-like protein with 3'-5' exonuclease and polymerase domains
MSLIAIDTETTGTYFQRGCRAFMVTACDSEGLLYCWEWEVDPLTREVDFSYPAARERLQKCYDTLNSYDTWIFHNAMFDLTALSYLPTVIPFERSFRFHDIHDTMLMAHCNNNLDRLGLKGLALQYMHFSEQDEKELEKAVTKARRYAKKQGWAIAEPSHPHLTPLKDTKGKCDYWLPRAITSRKNSLSPGDRHLFSKVCRDYATGDVERTMGLYLLFDTILNQKGDINQYLRNKECILPLWEMQREGLPLKAERIPLLLEHLDTACTVLITNMKKLLCKIGPKVHDFNPKSPIQLRDALYDTLKIEPISFTKNSNTSTDKEALTYLLDHCELNEDQDAFIRNLLTYRKLNTAASYLASYSRYEVDSKLFTNINPVGTITTRCASRNPNLQNISKQESDESSLDDVITINLRHAFGPPKGKLWICIDYGQLQLRIFAAACQDAFLLDAFDRGVDIHHAVACRVFSTDEPSELQRRSAKAINFGIIFGAGRRKIERMSGVEGSFDLFKSQFPLVDNYLAECERKAKRMGYIRTLGGYPIRVAKAKAYKACNMVVQGTEGEMVKKAIVDLYSHCYSRVRCPVIPIMTIHDEIIFQTKRGMTPGHFIKYHKKSLSELAQIMNEAGEYFGVKTTVDAKIVNTNWAESIKVSLE